MELIELEAYNILLVDLLPKLSENTKKCILSDLQKQNQMNFQQDTLYIFTDGGCKRNGNQNSKAAYSVLFTENQDSPFFQFNTSQHLIEEPTNNRAELSGILHIFKNIYENKTLFQNQHIIICTDSMYSINCIEKWSKNWLLNNWKNAKGQNVKNKELIQEILNYRDDLLRSGASARQGDLSFSIKFKHIFSHTSPPSDKNTLSYYLWYGNNKVDENINKLLEGS